MYCLTFLARNFQWMQLVKRTIKKRGRKGRGTETKKSLKVETFYLNNLCCS